MERVDTEGQIATAKVHVGSKPADILFSRVKLACYEIGISRNACYKIGISRIIL